MRKYHLLPILTALFLALCISPIMAADEAAAPAAPEPAASAPAAPEPAAEAPKVLTVGSKAENLMAKDETGNPVDIVKLAAGSNTMVVFMNTACSACLGELGMANGLANRFTKSKLIVVASDFGPFNKISAYKERNQFGGIWVQDEDFTVGPKFGFSYTPAMVVLGADGTVTYSKGGFMKSTAKQIENEVTAALRK